MLKNFPRLIDKKSFIGKDGGVCLFPRMMDNVSRYWGQVRASSIIASVMN